MRSDVNKDLSSMTEIKDFSTFPHLSCNKHEIILGDRGALGFCAIFSTRSGLHNYNNVM